MQNHPELWLLGTTWAVLFLSHQNYSSWLSPQRPWPGPAYLCLVTSKRVAQCRYCVIVCKSGYKSHYSFFCCCCLRNVAWCSWDLAGLIMLLILTLSSCSQHFSCYFFVEMHMKICLGKHFISELVNTAPWRGGVWCNRVQTKLH